MEHHHLSGADELSELVQDYEKSILEIGFGNGENLINLAKENPKNLYIGSEVYMACLLYTSPSPRDKRQSRMPSSA